ncbi:MAG: two-component system response regulator NarL [Candidatus Thiodiazotropha sp. (ex Troendleina suluensis)]|nr:two-component system response regulator NarL [Candidatus Thiodiazotropha sp. (ex Troendleina suluensis)]
MINSNIQRIVIIDDHPLLRKGLQQLANLSHEVEIIGETDNGEQGLALVKALQPDLVLLDLNMPGMNGLETLDALKQLEPEPKVIILTVSDTQEDVIAALRGGADGYLLKDMDPEELLHRISEVEEGKLILSPKIAEHLGDSLHAEVQRIVIIDDHPLLRKGLYQLVDLSPDLDIIGESDNGEQGLLMVQEIQPNLVLLDLNMPGMDGLETLHALKQLEPSPKVAILTVSDKQKDIVSALRRGADGYLLKDMDPEDLLDKLHELAEGRLVMSQNIAESLALALRAESQKDQESGGEELTERECEILIHISGGESNKVIARKLDIAEATVKVHVKHLLKKLGLKSRVEAAVWAITHKDKLKCHSLQ